MAPNSGWYQSDHICRTFVYNIQDGAKVGLQLFVYGDVQPTFYRLHAAQDGYECSPTQNHKLT